MHPNQQQQQHQQLLAGAGTYSSPTVNSQAVHRQFALTDFPAAFSRSFGVLSSSAANNSNLLTGKDVKATLANTSLAHPHVNKVRVIEGGKQKWLSRRAAASTKTAWCMPVEQLWCCLPDAIFVDIMQRVTAADIG
jgi:hypothetical protein